MLHAYSTFRLDVHELTSLKEGVFSKLFRVRIDVMQNLGVVRLRGSGRENCSAFSGPSSSVNQRQDLRLPVHLAIVGYLCLLSNSYGGVNKFCFSTEGRNAQCQSLPTAAR